MQKLDEIIIELSYNCNLSCSMCGFGKHVNPFHKEKFLPFEAYKSILQQIGSRTKTIRLNGRGESTIHPDFVEIMAYTKTSFPGLGINLFSNMSFKNEKVLNSLIDYDAQLFVSMDSPIEDELVAIRKGAKFGFIEENLRQLRKTRNRPFIIFTIQEDNIHRIRDMAQYAKRYDCHILYNTIRRDEGIESFVGMVKAHSQDILDQFEQTSQIYEGTGLFCLLPDQLAGIAIKSAGSTQTHGSKPFCPALESELCILYDGTVTPCNMFNPYVYGNIFEESIDHIWSGKKRLDFLTSHKSHYYCSNCANLGK